MKERLLRSLPLVVACLALASASQDPGAPLVVLALASGSVLVSPRLPLDRATQRLAMVVVIVLCIAGLRASGMPMHAPGLGAFGYGVAITPLALSVLRLWTRSPEGGARIDLSLALVSLLSTGAARAGLRYGAFVAAFLFVTVALQRSLHPHRSPLGEISPRTKRIGAAMLATALLFCTAAAVLAQFVSAQIHRRLGHTLQTAFEDSVGFSDDFRLGKVNALLASDAVVMRVSGPDVDRLRGIVLDEYGRGRWTRAKTEPLASIAVPRERPAGNDIVEVRHVHPEKDYIFLPLGARDVASPQGQIRADSMGVVHAIPGDTFPNVWFRLGERDSLRVSAAHVEDLLMPRKLRGPLTAIATEWARGTSSPEAALFALQSRLRRDEAYSLDADAPESVDPILDFLTVSHKGSCAHFASALALLARTIGIPTRLVLGYRVGERNPYWSHYVIRRKNAHAWVEAYLPDGSWMTMDPTPMTELPQDVAHDERGLAAGFEAVAVAWEYTEGWLARRTIIELGAAALVGVLFFAMQRWLRTRKSAATGDHLGLEFDKPPKSFLRLEAELGRRGRGRLRGESIERWAARLEDPSLDAVLDRYAGVRYGRADGSGLDAELQEAARRARAR